MSDATNCPETIVEDATGTWKLLAKSNSPFFVLFLKRARIELSLLLYALKLIFGTDLFHLVCSMWVLACVKPEKKEPDFGASHVLPTSTSLLAISPETPGGDLPVVISSTPLPSAPTSPSLTPASSSQPPAPSATSTTQASSSNGIQDPPIFKHEILDIGRRCRHLLYRFVAESSAVLKRKARLIFVPLFVVLLLLSLFSVISIASTPPYSIDMETVLEWDKAAPSSEISPFILPIHKAVRDGDMELFQHYLSIGFSPRRKCSTRGWKDLDTGLDALNAYHTGVIFHQHHILAHLEAADPLIADIRTEKGLSNAWLSVKFANVHQLRYLLADKKGGYDEIHSSKSFNGLSIGCLGAKTCDIPTMEVLKSNNVFQPYVYCQNNISLLGIAFLECKDVKNVEWSLRNLNSNPSLHLVINSPSSPFNFQNLPQSAAIDGRVDVLESILKWRPELLEIDNTIHLLAREHKQTAMMQWIGEKIVEGRVLGYAKDLKEIGLKTRQEEVFSPNAGTTTTLTELLKMSTYETPELKALLQQKTKLGASIHFVGAAVSDPDKMLWFLENVSGFTWDMKDDTGSNIVHYAARSANFLTFARVVRMAPKHLLHQENKAGIRPSAILAYNDFKHRLEYLVELGEDIHLKDSFSRSLTLFAQVGNASDTLDYLKSKGAS